MSGIWLPVCSKLAISWKNVIDVTIFRHDIIVKFFWHCFVSLVKFSYWSKFHVSIITGSGVMTIFFYKRLTRNPVIRNTPVWVLPDIWRLGWVTDTKFGTIVWNKILLNAAKCQGYSLYRFWVIKEKPTGGQEGVILLYSFTWPILLLYSFTWPNFIVWLLLLREILRNMRDVTVC